MTIDQIQGVGVGKVGHNANEYEKWTIFWEVKLGKYEIYMCQGI